MAVTMKRCACLISWSVSMAGLLLFSSCKSKDDTADTGDPALTPPEGTPEAGAEASPSGPPTTPVPYKVQPGDSFWKISQKYKVPMADIAKANNMTLDDTLVAGKTITVPVPEGSAPPPSEPEAPGVTEPETPEVTPPTPPSTPDPTEPRRPLVVPPDPPGGSNPTPTVPDPTIPRTPTIPPTPDRSDDGFTPLGGN